jgi:tetratricopeptide (TPR) repeat protein
VVEHVGHGSFGDVYRAWEPTLEREVALKILSLSARDSGNGSDVVREGRLMARVRHPNVVAIHGAQRIDGVTGLWMEFVDGGTLATELADRGPFDGHELAQVAVQLCDALQAVHDAGLIHRDVKTHNVLRDPRGRIVLGDFGTGREFTDATIAQGTLVGTPTYVAPEIFARQPATPQSDLYSLGVLLFNLASGSFPVNGKSLRELKEAHAAGERRSLRDVRPDLPDLLTSAIDAALEPDPAKRSKSAADMRRPFAQWSSSKQHGGLRARWLKVAGAAAVVLSVIAISLFYGLRSPALPFSARDWVLVAAFENRTGEPLLDGALDVALAQELAESSHVNVAPPERVKDALILMRKPTGTVVDLSTAREVALRDGAIRAVVAGRLDKIGSAYALTVTVVNPIDGAIVATLREAPVAEQELLRDIARVSVNLRAWFGESRQTLPARDDVPKVTTSSLRALQLYSQVVALETDEGLTGVNYGMAERLLDEAVRADPAFASAYMKLAIVRRLQGRLPEALDAIERAVSLSDSVTDVERLVILGELHGTRGFMATRPERLQHFERAAAAYEAVLKLKPDDHQALICLAYVYHAELRRPDVRIATRLVELRPNSAAWRSRAVTAALLAN